MAPKTRSSSKSKKSGLKDVKNETMDPADEGEKIGDVKFIPSMHNLNTIVTDCDPAIEGDDDYPSIEYSSPSTSPTSSDLEDDVEEKKEESTRTDLSSCTASKTFLLKHSRSSSTLRARDKKEELMRVLFYIPCYYIVDGVTITMRKLISEVLATGGQVCVLTTKAGRNKSTYASEQHPRQKMVFLDNAILFPFLYMKDNPDASYHFGFSISKSTREELISFSPNVVHVTAPDCCSLDVIQFARDFSIPLVGTYHTNFVEMLDHYGLFWPKPFVRWFSGHCYSFVQALYAPTPYVVSMIKDEHKYDECTNLKVWGRGVDLEMFSPRHRSLKFREDWGIQEDDVVICFVGRLVLEKRPDIFANVIRRLNEDPTVTVPFKALVIGAGDYYDELKKIPNCICTGLMKFDQLPVAYASSEIFLFPSSLETFGNVTLEAAASGLPLVVSEGCSSHLVVQGKSGYECADGDEDGYYEATKKLVMNKKMRREFSVCSREHSFHFEKRSVVQQMLTEYQKASRELHDEYEDDHKVRDLKWNSSHRNPYRAGPLVRPLGVRLLEYAVIYLGKLLWSDAGNYIYQTFLASKSTKNESKNEKSVKSSCAAPKKERFFACFVRITMEFLLFLFLLCVRVLSRPERVIFESYRREIRPRMSSAKRRIKVFLQQ